MTSRTTADRLRIALVGAAVGAAAAGLAGMPAQAQTLRGWDHGSFGRMVFDWNGPAPGMDWRQDGLSMVIEGERTIIRDVAYFLDFLSRYIADIRLEADGRRVVIRLTGPMSVEQLRLGDRWAFDFRLDPDAPVSAPEQFGTDDGPDDGQDEGAGDEPGEIASAGDTGNEVPALPTSGEDRPETGAPESGTPDSGTPDSGTPLTGEAEADPPLTGAADGEAVIAGSTDGVREEPSAEDTGPEMIIPVFGASRLGYSRVVLEFESAPDYAVRRRGDTIEVSVDLPVGYDLGDVDAAILPEVFGLQQSPGDGGSTLMLATMPGTGVRHFVSSERVVLDILAPNSGYQASEIEVIEPGTPATLQVEPLPEAQAAASDGPDGGEAVAGNAAVDDPPDGGAASAASVGDGGVVEGIDERGDEQDSEPAAADDQGPVPQASPPPPVEAGAMAREAVFDTGAPVGLAIFRRGEDLWLVFAVGEGDLSSADLIDQGEDGLGRGIAAEARGGVAIRYAGYDGPDPVVVQEGTAWRVIVPEAAASVEDGPSGLVALTEPDHPDGGRVLIEDFESFGPVAFIDPSVGDILVAMAPVARAGGLDRMQRFIDFRLLPSVQGLVVRPAVEDLRVRPLDSGVQITAESGLDLS